jgi:putative transposase
VEPRPSVPSYARHVPRQPRLQVAGRTYHVTSRGNRKQTIFTTARDVTRFLEGLTIVAEDLGWRVLAYCVMPNHYHLLVETPKADLSRGMHRIKTRYVTWFNRRHGVEGHLFERRFRSVGVDGTAHLLELFRYIAQNPVRASLCDDPLDWPWSSFAATAGLAPSPPFLVVDDVLLLFGDKRERAKKRFAAFVRNVAPRTA